MSRLPLLPTYSSARRVFITSAFFWVSELFAKSSIVKGLPSILAEKRELLRVDCLRMFFSMAMGIMFLSMTAFEPSMEDKRWVSLGVRVYFGGISILPNVTLYYPMLPDVDRKTIVLFKSARYTG